MCFKQMKGYSGNLLITKTIGWSSSLISCYRARALRHSVIVRAIRITKRTKTVFVLQVEENVAEEEMFSSQLLPDHRACYCECVCINV